MVLALQRLLPRGPMSDGEHTCFGCGKPLTDYEPHIHVGLDEFMAREGGDTALGLDDLLTFAFCEACTQRSENGWALESHEIDEARPS